MATDGPRQMNTPLPPDDSHWIRSPLTTRHSQATLLLVSFAWGLSYCMPANLRIPFSEVFPPDLTRWSAIPMWGWGAMLLISATFAFMGERIILERGSGSNAGWRASFLSHTMLVAVYSTLAIAALTQGWLQVAAVHFTAAAIISAISRPVLWGYIAYLHLTYARLPRPLTATQPRRRKGGRRKLRFVREEEVDGESDRS